MDTDTSRPSLAATGDSKTVRQTPAPALAAGPFVLSGGAICAGHAAAIWLHAAHWHASPSLHRFGELRELSVPAERHRLTVWDVWDMSGLPAPAGPVPPARVENNDILCVFPTNETRHM